jgi:hypothetical protein
MLISVCVIYSEDILVRASPLSASVAIAFIVICRSIVIYKAFDQAVLVWNCTTTSAIQFLFQSWMIQTSTAQNCSCSTISGELMNAHLSSIFSRPMAEFPPSECRPSSSLPITNTRVWFSTAKADFHPSSVPWPSREGRPIDAKVDQLRVSRIASCSSERVGW